MINNFRKEVKAFDNACLAIMDAIEAYEKRMKEAGKQISERKKLCFDYFYNQIAELNQELQSTVLDD